MTAISFRTDPEVDRALAAMTGEGHPRSQVIRDAILEFYRSWRETKTADEYDLIASWREADPEERELHAYRAKRRAEHSSRSVE